MTTLVSATALLGSLTVNAVSLTGMTTVSAELTCAAATHDAPMVAYSGGYTVATNGSIVDNKTLGEILVQNLGWLGSFTPPKGPYNPSKKISSLNIPCTAAVAEIQIYIS